MPKKPEIELPLKLVLDTTPDKQQPGTSPFMLNMINDAEEGAAQSKVSEPGNVYSVDLPGNIVGEIPIDRFQKAIFTDDGSISVFKSDTETLEVKVSALSAFGFSTDRPITGISRTVRGCETVIYWGNGYDPDRYFNLNRPEKFKTGGVFDISLFNLNYRAEHPVMSTDVLATGGELSLGKYFVVSEYLDDFENVLFTSPLTIADLSVNDNDEDGGYNIENYLPETGGVPKSNKAIQIDISNIPAEISLIRLIIYSAITGDGQTVNAHTVGNLIPVNNGKASYMYTGFDPTGDDVIVDFKQALAKRVIYQSSNYRAQEDGRLIRFGLKESVRDLSEFQKSVSRICTKYVCTDVPKEEAHKYRTEIGGEVKEYGIVFIWNDGTETDKFHIPGPPPGYQGTGDVGDVEQRIEVSLDGSYNCLEGYSFEIVFNVNGIPYYRGGSVRNGETRVMYIGTPSDVMEIVDFTYEWIGYYDPYDPSSPCNIFPEANIVSSVNPTSGDWRYTSTAVKDGIPELGYDSSGSMGYYVTGQRYENPPNYAECNDQDYWGEDCEGNPITGEYVRYHVIPDRSIEPLTIGDNARIIGVKFSNITYPHPDIVDHYFVSNIRDGFNSVVQAKGIMLPYMYAEGDDDREYDYTTGRYFNGIQGEPFTAKADPNYFDSFLYNFISPEYLFMGIVPQGVRVIEEGYYDQTVSETDKNILPSDDYFDPSLPYDEWGIYQKYHGLTDYSSVSSGQVWTLNRSLSINRRSEIDEIRNLSYSSKFNILSLTDGTHDHGNPIKYVSLKRSNIAFPNLYSIRSRRITELSQNVAFNGDGYISRFDMTHIAWLRVGDQNVIDLIFSEILKIFGGNTLIRTEFELIQNIYIESVVNPYYRHSGTNICSQYYDGKQEIFNYIQRRITEPFGTEDKNKLRDSLCEEWYGYNKDFSIVQDLNVYLPLPYTHDFCAECNNYYPTSYTWSEKSFLDDRADNYRVFLPNNVNTIQGNRGAIIAANVVGNKILLRTEQSAFLIQPNPQQLQTNESIVYIGVGDFLSLPEVELNVTDIGWGGQQHPSEQVLTDFGLVWVDRKRGKIILYSDSIKELNMDGVEHWFLNELSSTDDYCILTYDPKYKRLIVTLRNNWTISYNFKDRAWGTFHSYIPTFYLHSATHFFSEDNKKLWKHGSKQFAQFYGYTFPVVFEFIMNHQLSFDAESVWYYSRTEKYDSVTKQWVDYPDVTFDQVLLYNQNQSTGLNKLTLNLNGVDNIFYTPMEKFVTMVDRMYKISQFTDMAESNSIWTDDISAYQQGGHGYIDKTPVNIDETKPQAEQGYFNGKFIGVRLFMSNPDYRITVNLAALLEWYNKR